MTRIWIIVLMLVSSHVYGMDGRPFVSLTHDRIVTMPYTPDIDKDEVNEVVDALLINPQILNEFGHSMRSEFREKCEALYKKEFYHDRQSYNPDAYTKCHDALIEMYEARYPLLFLEECGRYNGGKGCFFNRSYYPEKRELFESVISEELIAKIDRSGKVVCCSFGAGNQLQDAIILAKVLSQYPSAHIHYHAIDVAYKQYDVDKRLSYIAQGDDGFDRTKYMGLEHRRFLAKTFPRAELQFKFLNNVEQYATILDANEVESPDIVFGIDLETSADAELRAHDTFRWLCAKVLSKKSHSRNHLFHWNNKYALGKIIASTVSLQKSEGAKKYAIEFPTAAGYVYQSNVVYDIEDVDSSDDMD